MKHLTSSTRSKALLLVCVLVVVLIFAFATASGLVPQDLSGEEFAVYHYANSYDHFTAWQRYYTEVGRPVSVAWWIYSFEIVGYNPPLLHFLSFALFLGASVLASICFYRAWPSKQKRTYLFPLLFLLFVFNWIGVELIFSVKFDQVHLALIFFFLAGLSLQAWSSSNMSRTGWLVLSLGLFLVSVFAYESVVFLYPGLLFLSWPLSQKKKDNRKHFIAIGFISLFFVALPYIVYRHIGLIGSNATYRGGLSTPLDPAHLVDYISLLANFGMNAHSFRPISSALATIVYLYALGAGVLVLISKKREIFKHEALHVVLASLWFIFMGLVPFALAGYSGTERAYSAAIFGLGPLIALSLTAKATKLGSATSWAAVFCICLLGIGQFFSESTQQVRLEAQQNRFFLDMRSLVPSVKSGTIFIFLDYPQSNNGCGPSFNMLYNRNDIRCAFLSSTLTEYSATRYMDHVRANRGGALRNENWVIIKMNENGELEIVSEISKGDFGLLIYWLSQEPIRTDFRRIENDEGIAPSEMVQFLEERNVILGQE